MSRLGLDIVYRKEFYDRLLNDYYVGNRTIVISTHQVEEIEALLTHLLFINRGKIVLDAHMSELETLFTEVIVKPDQLTQADGLGPIHKRELLGMKAYIYEAVPRAQLEHLGEVGTPSVADLFVAKMKEGSSVNPLSDSMESSNDE